VIKKIVREIIKQEQGKKTATILIHRYNTLDDTFIEYYRIIIEGKISVYKNIWVARNDTETYEGKLSLTENEYALSQLGK